jgi:CheY-like chemotaxis protein
VVCHASAIERIFAEMASAFGLTPLGSEQRILPWESRKAGQNGDTQDNFYCIQILLNLCLARMGKRILCVDDDHNWRLILETILKEAGYETRTAADPSQALVELEVFEPELLVLDLDIAGENGLMLLKFVKQNHPATRIMLYTGMDQDGEAIMAALDLGANSYVKKGSPDDLLREVELVFG